jgi:crotonobetainyl-CoA:carnitine CoA-transferase CaiB-like acyl-CoA transferase
MAGTPYTGAPYGIYPTSDGYIALAMNPVSRLMKLLGVDGWDGVDEQNITEPGLDTEIRRILAERLASRSTEAWLEVLLGADIWCAQLNDYDAVAVDPQVLHNGMIVEIDHPSAGPVKVVGAPIRFGGGDPGVPFPPPRLGEHTRDVLVRIAGYAEDEARELIR